MIVSFSEYVNIRDGHVKITVFKEHAKNSINTDWVKLEFKTSVGQFSTTMSADLFKHFVKCTELLLKLLHDVESSYKKDMSDVAKLGYGCSSRD